MPFRTCRFCKETNENLVKYGTRHYAHLTCLKNAFLEPPTAFERLLWKLPLYQLQKLNHFECEKLGIRALVSRVYEQRAYVTCSACSTRLPAGSLNGYGLCSTCQTAIENSKHFTKDFDLRKGDAVEINCDGKFTGTVLTANFWGEHSGWYVEFTSEPGGYGYWKQGLDGGTIAKVSR